MSKVPRTLCLPCTSCAVLGQLGDIRSGAEGVQHMLRRCASSVCDQWPVLSWETLVSPVTVMPAISLVTLSSPREAYKLLGAPAGESSFLLLRCRPRQ